MGLTLRWVGESDYDRVADVRLRCYAHSLKDAARYRDGIRADRRAVGNAYLLAEQDGTAVGTTASLTLQMWVRGRASLVRESLTSAPLKRIGAAAKLRAAGSRRN